MRIIGILHSVKLVSEVKADPGKQVFTSSGIFTVPRGVKQLTIGIVNGGKSGSGGSWSSSGSNSYYVSGSGGSSSGKQISVDVSGIKTLPVTVASAGGTSICFQSGDANAVTAEGGKPNSHYSGDGGWGASSGSDGVKCINLDGTWYAGSGGGGAIMVSNSFGNPVYARGAVGGAGGGGNGGNWTLGVYKDTLVNATQGGYGTGGGGGAGGCGTQGFSQFGRADEGCEGKPGGSGAVVVWWS